MSQKTAWAWKVTWVSFVPTSHSGDRKSPEGCYTCRGFMSQPEEHWIWGNPFSSEQVVSRLILSQRRGTHSSMLLMRAQPQGGPKWQSSQGLESFMFTETHTRAQATYVSFNRFKWKKEGCGAIAKIVTDDVVLWLNMITENILGLINIQDKLFHKIFDQCFTRGKNILW